MPSPHQSPRSRLNATFPTTSWTLVQKIQRGGEEDVRRALEEVCRSYWYPIYAYLRRSGQSPHDAEDLTQAFFEKLIEDHSMHRAHEERGRLRTFLLGVLKRTLADHFEKVRAVKRGGRVTMISFEEERAEFRYKHEPATLKNLDQLFDRAWAEGVLHAAEAKLRADYERGEDVETYDLLCEFLPLGENATPYAKVAARSQNTEATVRLQVHRMRKRYAKLIEQEIAETVDGLEEMKAELAHLMAVMGR